MTTSSSPPRQLAGRSRALLLALAGCAAAVLIPVSIRAVGAQEMVDTELDLCRMRMTFADDFDTAKIASRDITGARWIAHTPWNGDFGDAAFTDPGPSFPFRVENGVLSITATRGADGRWRSGLIASADSQGRGFAQQYGYFEARAKFPAGVGLWPAFWLNASVPNDATEPTMEVDVVEHYGHAPDGFNSGIHVWHKNPTRDEVVLHETKVPSGSLYEGFHTYGVKVDPQHVTFYLDREPIWQQDTPKQHNHKLMLLANLALGGGWPIEKAPSGATMEIDYIRAYSLNDGGSLPDCSGKTAEGRASP